MKFLSVVVLLLLSTVMLGQQGTMIGAAVPPFVRTKNFTTLMSPGRQVVNVETRRTLRNENA